MGEIEKSEEDYHFNLFEKATKKLRLQHGIEEPLSPIDQKATVAEETQKLSNFKEWLKISLKKTPLKKLLSLINNVYPYFQKKHPKTL